MTFRCDNCLIDVEEDTACPLCGANLMPKRDELPDVVARLARTLRERATKQEVNQ